MKTCYQCKSDKEYSEFYVDKYTKDGYKSCCKNCSKERVRKWKEENPDKARAGINRWRKENQQYWNNYCKSRRGTIPKTKMKGQRAGKSVDEARIYIKKWKAEYDVENRESNSQYHKERFSDPLVRARFNEYRRNKWREDLNYRLSERYRNRIGQSLRSQKTTKNIKSTQLLGCSVDDFIKWLELNFEEGMTWDNFGSGNDKWNIEHWLPCCSFDLSNSIELHQCFNWSNMFPCWQIENLRKGKKILGPLSPKREANKSLFQQLLKTPRDFGVIESDNS